jgi:predicted RNA binding protein YcfA (HicA-like mRNA interferase family)
VKVREIIKLIEDDGWFFVNQTGSHRQYKHPNKPGRVTVPVHKMSADLNHGLQSSILKQARIQNPEKHNTGSK